jgi:hypothetical protein
MASYNLQQIAKIISNRPNEKRIRAAQKYNDKLMLHLHGKGMKNAMKRMDYFENSDIYKARIEYAMSNVDMFARLLREEEQVFTARGGSVTFNMPKDKEKEMYGHITNLVYDQSLRKWVGNFAINAYRADPMGVIVMEIEQAPEEGSDNVAAGKPLNAGIQMPKCYPVYRSIQDVWDYKNVGQKLDYVCFVLSDDELVEYGIKQVTPAPLETLPTSRINKQKRYFRFIDDSQDVIVERISDTIVEQCELVGAPNPLPNPWGKCNAFVVSDILMFSDPQALDTPLRNVVELADSYLKGRSVRDLQKNYHGFAKAIEPLLKCSSCGGDGIINQNGAGEGFTKGRPCPECTLPGQTRGTGYKLRTKISDVAKFPLEMIADANFDYKKIFGYVTPDIASWDKQDDTVNSIEDLTYTTYWGCAHTTLEGYNGSQSIKETATKTVANLAPKFARMNTTADWAEKTENTICNWMGQYYYGEQWKGSNIIYSREYIFETPDTILATYYDMKANGMTDSMLDDQYKKYIKALYQSNPAMQDICLKKFSVEPFPHLLAADVESSIFVDPIDKVKKRYFGEWEETITSAQWITQDRATLDKSLTEYAKTKTIDNGETETSPADSGINQSQAGE